MGDEYGDCTLHQGRLVQSLSRTVRVGRQGRQAHQGCLRQGRCVKDAFYGASRMRASGTRVLKTLYERQITLYIPMITHVNHSPT